MVEGDVGSLEVLLADELIFVNHFGQFLTKQDDLAAHCSKILKFSNVEIGEQVIKLLGDVAVTSTKAFIQGTVGEEEINHEMSYSRVWKEQNGSLHVVAGHCSAVVS
jgi:hypothetical protein